MGRLAVMRAAPSLYEILQVDRQADPEVIEAAYRRLARKYHPDTSGLADGGRRMKELSAAYEVLRDPARRASYDRELLAQAAAETSAPPPTPEPAPAPDPRADWDQAPTREAWFACRQHPTTPAVGTCGDCGVALCGYCFDRFQPSSCPNCILAWAGRRRRELMIPAVWFFAVVGLLTYAFLHALDDLLHTQPLIVALELLGGYLIASFPSGWRITRPQDYSQIGDDDLLFGCLLGLVLGPIVAPFRMAKVVSELRQVKRLEAIARGPE
jgi:DnaJ-domain-containing protein 1